MITFLDTHRAEYAVESIRKLWLITASTHCEHKCRHADPAPQPPAH